MNILTTGNTYKQIASGREFKLVEIAGDLLDLVTADNNHEYVTKSELESGYVVITDNNVWARNYYK